MTDIIEGTADEVGTDVVHGGVRHAAIHEWDEGFQRLVRSTVLKPSKREATNAELALLAEHAVRTGLDPMSRQIYGVYRYDKRAGDERMTIQVGIDGFRAVAERTGAYVGQSGPFWCGVDGEWHEVWFHAEPPKAAKVIVRKMIGEHVAETPAVAHWDEYAVLRDGKPTGMWRDKPALMLAKCAEALALRKGFPQDLSGLYTDDEMGRAPTPTAGSPHPNISRAERALNDLANDGIVPQELRRRDVQRGGSQSDVTPDDGGPAKERLPEYATRLGAIAKEAIDAGVLTKQEALQALEDVGALIVDNSVTLSAATLQEPVADDLASRLADQVAAADVS